MKKIKFPKYTDVMASPKDGIYYLSTKTNTFYMKRTLINIFGFELPYLIIKDKNTTYYNNLLTLANYIYACALLEKLSRRK